MREEAVRPGGAGEEAREGGGGDQEELWSQTCPAGGKGGQGRGGSTEDAGEREQEEQQNVIQVKDVGDEEELWAALKERDSLLERKGKQLEGALDEIERLRGEREKEQEQKKYQKDSR